MSIKLKDILTREQKIKLMELAFKHYDAICTKYNIKLEFHYYRLKRCDNCKYVKYERKEDEICL